ncbi:MAG: hypothetical protein JWN25_99 [Verrucomicrobiales bacterium]|nr:hypothetical protein [Verrucomicrobiales bacterium]
MKTRKFFWLIAISVFTLFARVSVAQEANNINPALTYWMAFSIMPNLSEDDHKYLFDNDWRSKPMDARAGKIAAQYDQTFKLLKKASLSTTAPDWGVDLHEGPYALYPHLAKGKNLAQVAALRGAWFVQNKQPAAAAEDLKAVIHLGGSLTDRNSILAGLVRFAMDNIVLTFLAERWYELPTETIQDVLSTIDKHPVNGLMASSIPVEKILCEDWFLRKIQEIQTEFPGNDQKALESLSVVLREILTNENGKKEDSEVDIIKAAGSTTAGLISYTQELSPFYAETERVMNLPYPEFKGVAEALDKQLSSHPNILVRNFLPSIAKARNKEFRAIANRSMLHAALQYRLDNSNGLASVQDPFGNGPFVASRFAFEGADRGFKLKSALDIKDSEVSYLFVEKPGSAFQVQGPRIGQAVH